MILIISIIAAILLGGIIYGLYRKQLKKQKVLLAAFNEEDTMLFKLQPKVTWCRYLENVDDYGINLANQYDTIKKIHQSCLDMLSQKFSSTEMTFVRYQQTIDASYQILVDNLSKLIPLLETLDNKGTTPVPADSDLKNQIDQLFVLNQNLIEKLNELIVNLSKVKNLTGPDEQATQYLLDNLKVLIERAKIY